MEAIYPENIYPIQLSEIEQKITATLFKLRIKKKKNTLTPREQLFLNLVDLSKKVSEHTLTIAIQQELTRYTFPAFLADYLKTCALKQQQLCTDLGISKSYLSKVLNGKKSPSADFLAKLEIHANHIIKAKELMILVIMEDIPQRLAEVSNHQNLDLKSIIAA